MKCCERDYNEDGTCDIHSAPGVLRSLTLPAWPQEDLMERYLNDARFHQFVDRLIVEALEAERKHRPDWRDLRDGVAS